ncbi:hypothetical protein RMSM_04379 [Rhodopirellula maiorica SM1]|uniref:Uncharacterized protein n=1 Tax=Rhodopirellula maiorica SM1 TaxID=1265738 RepID=M5RH65_9BACT|nr:hypothetical protein [Rhodopirellula maiorica]EMI18685.1 hypothetical protein RMSM_04379 [Rhodopirellula maiorica SM1]
MILSKIRTEIFEKHFQPSHVEQIKAAMRKILSGGQKSGGEKLYRQQLAKIELQIEKAVERMTEVPPDMIKHVAGRIRKLEDDRDAVRSRLAESDKTPAKRIEAVDERIQAAIGWLESLETLVETEYDPVKVNSMLHKFVDRVDFHMDRQQWGDSGTRYKCEVTGGVIYFRTEALPFGISGVCEELEPSPKRS